MLDKLSRVLSSPWAIGAILLLGALNGKDVARKTARAAIKGGLMASDGIKGIAGQTKGYVNDLIDEIREERASNGSSGKRIS